MGLFLGFFLRHVSLTICDHCLHNAFVVKIIVSAFYTLAKIELFTLLNSDSKQYFIVSFYSKGG